MLTKKQAREYIASGGNHCPFCKSKKIEAGPVQYEEPLVQDVTCSACGKKWTDTLTVTEVREQESEEPEPEDPSGRIAKLERALQLHLDFLASLPTGWLAHTTADIGLLNQAYIASRELGMKIN